MPLKVFIVDKHPSFIWRSFDDKKRIFMTSPEGTFTLPVVPQGGRVFRRVDREVEAFYSCRRTDRISAG